jgi:hypothetical protein
VNEQRLHNTASGTTSSKATKIINGASAQSSRTGNRVADSIAGFMANSLATETKKAGKTQMASRQPYF